MITIVDYGMGNLGSIANMVRRIGGKSIITSSKNEIKKAEKLILPGVGAFDNGMQNLKKLGLIEIFNQKVLKDKIPVLGICLGMQLLGNSSEEGKLSGLGWIDGKTVKFQFENGSKLKIPHMGWNSVVIKKKSKLFENMPRESRFYFVHSYHLICNDKKDILAITEYGYDFTSAVERENIYGVQFHPEKSHKFGMQLLKNFIELS